MQRDKKGKIETTIGYLLLGVPLCLLGLWWYVCGLSDDYETIRHAYQSRLPVFLHGRYASNLFSLPFCIAGTWLAARHIRSVNQAVRCFARILFFLAAGLVCIQLWSMM